MTGAALAMACGRPALGADAPASLAAAPEAAVTEIVVSASRVPTSRQRLPVSVSVIDEDDLAAYGTSRLATVLRQSTAVSSTANGGLGATATLRVRGEEGFRTVVLMDGLRLSDPGSPQVSPRVEHLLTSGIGRVEVLRGPQGLSHGADAGGIIHITSPAVAGSRLGLSAQAGSRGTREVDASAALAASRYKLFLSAANVTTDGHNARLSDAVTADADGYDNLSAHAKFSAAVAEGWQAELVHRQVRADAEYDGCFLLGRTVHDCVSTYDLRASRAAVAHSGTGLSQSLAVASTATAREDFALAMPAFASTGRLSRLEYLGNGKGLADIDLVWGLDWEREANGSERRNNLGYHVEALGDFSSRWRVTAGLRRDANDDYGRHDSYRLAAAYLLDLPAGTLKVKSSLGSGFRAPSLYEIAYNAGPFSFPPASDTHLKEERSRGMELGLEYFGADDTHLEATAFHHRLRDGIRFDLGGYSGYLQETGAGWSRGVELHAELGLGAALRLHANYTYNDTRRPDGSQRLRRPRHLANVGLRWAPGWLPGLRVNGFLRGSWDAVDENFGSAVALDDIRVLDLTASYRFDNGVELTARLENAADYRYSEVADFNAPRRAAYLGIRLGR